MPRFSRTVLPFVCLPLFLSAGCSTIYRPVYSPGKSNYKKPPETASTTELLPPASGGGTTTTPTLPPADGGLPLLPAASTPAPDAPATPAPGTLDTPAIPGLPQ